MTLTGASDACGRSWLKFFGDGKEALCGMKVEDIDRLGWDGLRVKGLFVCVIVRVLNVCLGEAK